MSDGYVLILLSILLFVTNAFWAYNCMQLTNRLMSRNYFEFTQGKMNLKTKPQTHQAFQIEGLDPETERQAKELNSLMGIV